MEFTTDWMCAAPYDHQGHFRHSLSRYSVKSPDSLAAEPDPMADLDWTFNSVFTSPTLQANTPTDSDLSSGMLLSEFCNAQSPYRPSTFKRHSTSDSLGGVSSSSPDQADQLSRKERRRAQNRKAQQAFRDRKDRAISILEKEVHRLRGINQSLTNSNEAHERSISDLKNKINSIESAKSPTSDMTFELEAWDCDFSSLGFEPALSSPIRRARLELRGT